MTWLKKSPGMGSILLASVAFSLALVAARIWRSDSLLYSSLVWNLFLAWIPYAISLGMSRRRRWFSHGLSFGLAAATWLLFFPNAPYLVTDLFHLRSMPRIPLWYDLLLIFSFAWNGLILGFLSLVLMEREVQRRFGPAAGMGFVGVVMGLSAYGVFLGRFLRWNSWDVITDPFTIARGVLRMVLHPFDHPGVWGMTLLFAVLLTLIYATLKNFPLRR